MTSETRLISLVVRELSCVSSVSLARLNCIEVRRFRWNMISRLRSWIQNRVRMVKSFLSSRNSTVSCTTSHACGRFGTALVSSKIILLSGFVFGRRLLWDSWSVVLGVGSSVERLVEERSHQILSIGLVSKATLNVLETTLIIASFSFGHLKSSWIKGLSHYIAGSWHL